MSQEKQEYRTAFKETVDGTDVTVEVSGEAADVHEVAWKIRMALIMREARQND